jgi:hypothetical protein
MKKIKGMICVILALIMMFTTSACADMCDSDSTCSMKYAVKQFDSAEEVVSVDYFCFTTLIGDDVEIVEFSVENDEQMEKHNRGLFDFIVNKYDLDWKYQSVKVVGLDFSKVAHGEYAYYAAMADPDCNIVYLNLYLLHTSQDFLYRTIHELIHCMVYLNNGTINFAIYRENGKNIGYYVSEAITDLIAVDYLNYLGVEGALDYFLNGSNYCYTVVALQVLEHSIPDMKKMYLNVDAESFRQELQALGSMYIEDGADIDYGEVFFYQADMYQFYSIATLSASTMEEYTYYMQQTLKCMLGNYEIACAVSDKLDYKEEKMVLQYIEHIFELENGSVLMAEYIDYFRQCMK